MAVARWYPSKVDAWIAAVLALGPVLCAAAVVAVPADERAVALAAAGLLVAIYGGLVFPMRYAITADHVIVRHGLVRQRIPLADITEVKPTRSPLSSPALSLDRLAITFGAGFFKSAMISPAAKDDFLAELAAKAGLVRDGDRLVRGA